MKKRYLRVVIAFCIVILTATFAFYFMEQKTTKPSWMVPNNFVVFEQDITWEGHNATEYMYWNVTAVRGDVADIRLVSHGVNVSSLAPLIFPEQRLK